MTLKNNIEGIIIKWAYQIEEVNYFVLDYSKLDNEVDFLKDRQKQQLSQCQTWENKYFFFRFGNKCCAKKFIL